jgi:hypothetical protein
MLPPFQACCSQTYCRLFEHVTTGHVATFSSMLQPDMLPPFRACCSRTCCRIFKHAAARHIAAFLSMWQPDMLPPFRACCSRTCCRIFEHVGAGHVQLRLLLTRDTSMCSTGLFNVHTSRCSSGPWGVEKVQEQLSRYIQVQLKPLYSGDTLVRSTDLCSVDKSRSSIGFCRLCTFRVSSCTCYVDKSKAAKVHIVGTENWIFLALSATALQLF